ncbi:hypothetical protein SAMN05880570_0360 [Paenibacillus sp. RU4T]|nr:hypothetical protein SAMN05880555_0360 [Paenibacillus sp. RU4X]SIQ22052.1 hypothetical protein SAMN05880570_0360 [Paenibacillus sp. RU4T]
MPSSGSSRSRQAEARQAGSRRSCHRPLRGAMPLAASRRHAVAQLAASCICRLAAPCHLAASRRAHAIGRLLAAGIRRLETCQKGCAPPDLVWSGGRHSPLPAAGRLPASRPSCRCSRYTNQTRLTMTSRMNRTRMMLVLVHPAPPAYDMAFNSFCDRMVQSMRYTARAIGRVPPAR